MDGVRLRNEVYPLHTLQKNPKNQNYSLKFFCHLSIQLSLIYKYPNCKVFGQVIISYSVPTGCYGFERIASFGTQIVEDRPS